MSSNAAKTSVIWTSGGVGVLMVGDVLPEGHVHAGWIYGGVSRSTAKPFYIAPRDSGVMRWHEAMDFAERSGASIPSYGQLKQIFGAREEGALKGTFDIACVAPAGRYWSSMMTFNGDARVLQFGAGAPASLHRFGRSSLRCVRG